VTTLAGSGTAGYADGVGAAASFNSPYGLGCDAAGNLFLSDVLNHRIRKITPAGVVTTLAGSGVAGLAEGTGAEASFSSPHGLTVDVGGNIYVADRNNHRIRKVTPAGVVTTLAGSTRGLAEGTGAAAKFDNPHGIGVDLAGNVYLADTNNLRIRKVTAAGVVTTLATGFNTPVGIAVDAAANVYVGATYNYSVRKVTPAGVVTTLAGSTAGYVDATGTAAKFNRPHDVALDARGNVYVCDRDNHRIRKVTPAGVVTTVAGSGTPAFADGTGAAASFDNPIGIVLDPAGNVYVSDVNNHRIRKIDPVGVGQIAVAWSEPSTAGSSPIVSYVATASAAGQPTRACTANAPASTCTIRGLTSDVAYDVSVTASNADGSGPPSVGATATPN
jgi:sugar lactone lactonase YvrE